MVRLKAAMSTGHCHRRIQPLALGRRRGPVEIADAHLAAEQAHAHRLLQRQHAVLALPVRGGRTMHQAVQAQALPAQVGRLAPPAAAPVESTAQADHGESTVGVGEVHTVGIEVEGVQTVLAQVQRGGELAACRHVAQAVGGQPRAAVALVSHRQAELQLGEVERGEVALGIERDRTAQLHRIGIAHAQPADGDRAAMRLRVQRKLHGMIGKVGVDRTEQQLAATQRAFQIDAGRTVGGIEHEAPAAAQTLRGQLAGRRIETQRGQVELSGRLDAVGAPIQRHHCIHPPAGRPTGPDRTDQPLQPAERQVLQLDLGVGGLVQRHRRGGPGLALAKIDEQRIGRLIHLQADRGVTQGGARCTLELQWSIQYPAALRIALQQRIEMQAHAAPAHRRDIRPRSVELQPQPAGIGRCHRQRQLLQGGPRHRQGLRGQARTGMRRRDQQHRQNQRQNPRQTA
jgi:hypothetical protein